MFIRDWWKSLSIERNLGIMVLLGFVLGINNFVSDIMVLERYERTGEMPYFWALLAILLASNVSIALFLHESKATFLPVILAVFGFGLVVLEMDLMYFGFGNLWHNVKNSKFGIYSQAKYYQIGLESSLTATLMFITLFDSDSPGWENYVLLVNTTLIYGFILARREHKSTFELHSMHTQILLGLYFMSDLTHNAVVLSLLLINAPYAHSVLILIFLFLIYFIAIVFLGTKKISQALITSFMSLSSSYSIYLMIFDPKTMEGHLKSERNSLILILLGRISCNIVFIVMNRPIFLIFSGVNFILLVIVYGYAWTLLKLPYTIVFGRGLTNRDIPYDDFRILLQKNHTQEFWKRQCETVHELFNCSTPLSVPIFLSYLDEICADDFPELPNLLDCEFMYANPGELLSWFDKCKDADCSAFMNEKAIVESTTGDFTSARETFKKLLKKDVKNVFALDGWAQIELAENNYDETRALWMRSISSHPEDAANVWFNMGIMEENIGNHEASKIAYEKSIGLKDDSNLAQAYTGLGMLLHENFLDEKQEARKAYEQAIALDDSIPQAQLGYAKLMFYEFDEYENALFAYKKVLVISNSNPGVEYYSNETKVNILSNITEIEAFLKKQENVLEDLEQFDEINENEEQVQVIEQ